MTTARGNTADAVAPALASALPRARIADFCVTGTGGTPSRTNMERYYEGGTIPWVKSGELRETTILETAERVTSAAISETNVKMVPAGALLLAMYGATVGRLAMLGVAATTNQAVCHIIPDPQIADVRYVFHCLRAQVPTIVARGVGGAQPNISQGLVKRLQVPLPPLPEQRRISEILDRADALRAKRRTVLGQLDTLTQSIFLDMFGDPATNPKGWPIRSIRDLSDKISDGPFGSNLKTSHYQPTGVRVVRLTNIGIGEFVDRDKVFVSHSHFASLKQHQCEPGDVLIATMGDPNLRACIQPSSLRVALNKADCVQMRPKRGVVTSAFICALLNQPSVEAMAQDLIVGQTRLRISMGRLRTLLVPVPPVSLQEIFSLRVATVDRTRAAERASLTHLDTLFAATQHRAFRGEL